MPVDEMIPRRDPAGSTFNTRSYAGPLEPFFDAQAEVVDIDVPYTLGATTDFAELSVVNYNEATGAITMAQYSAGASNANAILAQPLQGESGDTGRVALHTSGHWSTLALIYHASFDTNAKKEQAFLKSDRPMLRASTPKFQAGAIDIPN
jgi:hypothetical protein